VCPLKRVAPSIERSAAKEPVRRSPPLVAFVASVAGVIGKPASVNALAVSVRGSNLSKSILIVHHQVSAIALY
jgi:hypothetical protein